jgi:hypothetical protein
MLFSVGAGAGAAVLDGDDVVVVVVVVAGVVDGAWLALVPHPAVTAPMTTRAAPLAARPIRRGRMRFELMMNVPVRVAIRRGDGERRVVQSVPVALSLVARMSCLLSD